MLNEISPFSSPQLPEMITPAKIIVRFALHERAKNAFTILFTGEIVNDCNIILVKGVTCF
ncbi:MAG: RbsD/FucU domain-containing protein [Bacteroidales bacterium]|jgi:L-fucose mutarotase/ribose pyranase (RbsD/FucU family)|nr:RbsD/FucU domain-containing protein [Bacteroidales bacterium]